MERPVKIILFIILGLVIVNFAMSIFGGSTISSIRSELEAANRNADSALTELKNAKNGLDSIRSDMGVLKSSIGRIQSSVTLNDNQKKDNEEKANTRLAGIREKIKTHIPVKQLDDSPAEIEITKVKP